MQTAVWGPHVWALVHATACGVGSGMPARAPLPRAVSKMMRALRGVLPCTFCRKSYDGFFKQLEEKAGAPFEELLCADLPRFTYDLHELVNDKLDAQRCETAMAQLGLPSRVSQALRARAMATGAFRGRRISFEVWERRQQVSPTVLSPGNVLDVLFVTALNYPEDSDEDAAAAAIAARTPGADTMPPSNRRKLYRTWLKTLPAALRSAGMTCELPDILTYVWGACTRRVCPAPPADLPVALLHKLKELRLQLARDGGVPRRAALFDVIFLVRAMFQDMRCLRSVSALAAAREELQSRYEAARVPAFRPPEGSCADGACYLTRRLG